MYGCQNWQCSAGDSPEPTAKKYKKTTYDKITNDGVQRTVQVENLDPTGLRKILLYTCTIRVHRYTNVPYGILYYPVHTRTRYIHAPVYYMLHGMYIHECVPVHT